MTAQVSGKPPRLSLPWPLPALLAWGGGWLACAAAARAGAGLPVALGVGTAVASIAAVAGCSGRRRRLIAAGGFPLSALAAGSAAGWPAWAWLLLLLPLLAAYPPRAWRDAPYFPTPAGALDGLAAVVSPPPSRVLDAGCGSGAGIAALRRVWPQAAIEGVEWSPLLAWVAARRCRGAAVRRGDMWAGSWAGYDVVYLFQRPESMARAWDKACREMAPGRWLVSLEFVLPGVEPAACLQPRHGARSGGAGGKPVWIYRLPRVADRARSTGGSGGR